MSYWCNSFVPNNQYAQYNSDLKWFLDVYSSHYLSSDVIHIQNVSSYV